VFAGIRWQLQERLNMEPIALSINDTAKLLSLGRTSIYGMIADGRLEAFRLGRRRLVRMESIKRLVAAQG